MICTAQCLRMGHAPGRSSQWAPCPLPDGIRSQPMVLSPERATKEGGAQSGPSWPRWLKLGEGRTRREAAGGAAHKRGPGVLRVLIRLFSSLWKDCVWGGQGRRRLRVPKTGAQGRRACHQVWQELPGTGQANYRVWQGLPATGRRQGPSPPPAIGMCPMPRWLGWLKLAPPSGTIVPTRCCAPPAPVGGVESGGAGRCLWRGIRAGPVGLGTSQPERSVSQAQHRATQWGGRLAAGSRHVARTAWRRAAGTRLRPRQSSLLPAWAGTAAAAAARLCGC